MAQTSEMKKEGWPGSQAGGYHCFAMSPEHFGPRWFCLPALVQTELFEAGFVPVWRGQEKEMLILLGLFV